MATTVKKTKEKVTVTTVDTETGDRTFKAFPNLGTPILDRVLVEQAPADEYSEGGIIIPDIAKEKPSRGVVIAIGSGRKDEPLTVKPGDTVLYGKYAGTEVQLKGRDYLLMREADILMIVNN